MTKVVWETPPPAASARMTEHDAIAAQLKSKPGQWALIMEDVCSTHASAINRGDKKAYRPKGEFEATSRVQSDGTGKYKIYARYVGK